MADSRWELQRPSRRRSRPRPKRDPSVSQSCDNASSGATPAEGGTWTVAEKMTENRIVKIETYTQLTPLEESEMSRIRAVVYGVGAMNSIVTRMLLEKGVDIVGALARSPEKVGQDLGTVAGLGREIGVIIEDDAEKLFSSRTADIAVVAVSSYMDGLYEHLRVCAEHGVNAVTIGEEALYPWNTSPVLTAELDALAKQNNCTISASGCQDTFWVNIVNLLMGAAHRVDSVVGRVSWNVDDYGPEVAADQRVGSTAADFESWVSNAGDRPPTFGRNVLDALVADAGLTIGKITNSTRPEIATEPMKSVSLNATVQPGDVIGFTDIDEITTLEGPTFSFEMSGKIYGPDEADCNEWKIFGEPNLELSNGAVPSAIVTCTQMVNRVPDVISAEPGYVTMEKLPRLRYRHFPLSSYLR